MPIRRGLVLLLAALLCAACGMNPGNPNPSQSPTAVPTANSPATDTPAPSPDPTPTPTSVPTGASTATRTATPRPTHTPGPEALYRRLIRIDQDRQTMYVYEGGELIRRIPVSTGIPDQPETMTPAWEGEVGRFVGTFTSFGVWADEAWYLFDHYGSMLIHGAPYIEENGQKEYQELELLGVRPASHGCIRLPPEESTWFSAWKPRGAHVIIDELTRTF